MQVVFFPSSFSRMMMLGEGERKFMFLLSPFDDVHVDALIDIFLLCLKKDNTCSACFTSFANALMIDVDHFE